MPRVKIDYVVSFSSEDPENQANNLLEWNVSKLKWLCNKGEPSCSVVLQLTRAVKIETIHIGAYQAALVEVLVGRSEKPNEPFQVLVPSCVFLSPSESRREEGAERVRSFTAAQLADGARGGRWDRLRVVCSQPYNKHCKYGLSFVHIFEPESASAALMPAAGGATTALELPPPDDDDDDEMFRPGELFAKHHQITASTPKDTGSQIRQATSHALKNISDSSTKLIKTPIAKVNTKQKDDARGDGNENRRRNNLMYTEDDEKPDAKIDGIIQKHRDKVSEERDSQTDKNTAKKQVGNKCETSNNENKAANNTKTPEPHKRDETNRSSNENSRKRPHPKKDDDNKRGEERPLASVLRGVVFALSGYQQPRRGQLRALALAAGARYRPHWAADCTHLVCAFPNTPKLREVRASSNGASCPVVTGEWIERCHQLRRLLPWRWFATETQHRITPSGDDLKLLNGTNERDASSESDTDDEIEKVLSNQKKQHKEASPLPRTSNEANVSHDSDVTFVRDERIQGNVVIDDSDNEGTEEERPITTPDNAEEVNSLPDFFEGFIFVIDDQVEQSGFDKALLNRYIRAYGGEVIEASDMDSETGVNYVLCTSTSNDDKYKKAQTIRPDWVWRCHQERRLYPIEDYSV